MSDDIVARLRLWADWLDDRCPDTAVMSDLREAVDEIERLRAERNEARHGESVAIATLQGVIEERTNLRSERDAARGEVCLIRAARTEATDVVDQAMADYAVSRGWDDLFKEETDGRG